STGLSVTDTRSGGRVATPSIQVAQALSTLGTAPLTAISRSGTPRDNKSMGNPASGITLTAAASATLTLAFNGTLRDRVGQGNFALGADGALDGTLTATLSAEGGRTITALRLDSNAPGTWTTNDPGFWVVGVATTLDGPLLNAPGSMAVNFPVANGGNFLLFASDYLSSEFLPGRTLTLTATFSDGSSASAVTTVSAAPLPATLTLAFNGTLRDRVGQGNFALGADGALDGTLTATLSAQGGRTITALRLDSNAPGTWTTNNPQFWVLGVATTLDGPLLNAPGSMAVNFPVANGGSFLLFASDYLSSEFLPSRTLTLTVTFSDGSSASARSTVSAAPPPATLTLAFNGTLRDRVGQGNLALGADGALDGTLTATLSAEGERTITALRLDSNAP